jgi:DNA polymerase III sliding clamp (beta) subunit (PCNA family)
MNNNPIIKLPVAELKTAIGGISKVLPRHSTLPVLGMIYVERNRQGWVYLSATDLDTFLTLRLEAPGQNASPVKFLVPFSELQKLGKSCPADETLELEPLAEDRLILRHRIGSHPVEQVISSLPASDFPEAPNITASPISLDEAARATLLNALDCASEDETRVILNGAYLDVSKPGCHCVVATDGRHLFASNSLHLPLPASVLIPDHRFLSWSGFVKDGQWKLAVQEPKKEASGYLRLESRRWTFITKQVEGTYPNWRNITEEVREFSGFIDISEAAAQEVQGIIPRLPGDDSPNHTVGLCVYGRKLFLRGWDRGQERATEVEVPGVAINGNPATVYCNRQYLLKALGFGLCQIGVQEPLRPLRFSDGGSRQMIVMPVRVDADASMSSNRNTPASASASPITPAVASADATPDQTTVNHKLHPQERNTTPMQNGINNSGNGHQAATTNNDTASTGEKSSLEQALDQIEFIKGSIRGAVANLNNLADTLRQVQRERRLNEREIRNVRDTLKSLQTVRL